MKAELINPFIDSALNVLQTMASTTATPGTPAVKKGNKTHGVVTGLIGLSSSNLAGNMILSFDAPCILGIVSNMLMEEFTEVNDDVVDAVGELTNMISGGAKQKLSELGYSFDMATPVMIRGENTELRQLTENPVITIPFKSDKGELWIEANLAASSKS